MREIKVEDRPTCSCEKKMRIVEYKGYYETFNYFECGYCEVDPDYYKADDYTYEYHNEPVGVLQIPQAKFDKHLNDIIAESVGTEVKDLDWLKREIHKELESWHGVEGGIDGDGINEIMLLINQLDEPETLSQKWIDEHKFNIDTYDEVINVDDLQNLLVPKQEITGEQFVNYAMDNDLVVFEKEALEDRDEMIIENYTKNKVVIEKPVIPKFVADYIEEGKDLGSDLGTAMTVQTELLKGIRDYIKNNEELFARAWLYGYTIKKENKYYTRIKGWKNVTTGSEAFNWVYFKEKNTVGISKAVENKYQAVSFTKYDWDNLGINEHNADFVLVEELEE